MKNKILLALFLISFIFTITSNSQTNIYAQEQSYYVSSNTPPKISNHNKDVNILKYSLRKTRINFYDKQEYDSVGEMIFWSVLPVAGFIVLFGVIVWLAALKLKKIQKEQSVVNEKYSNYSYVGKEKIFPSDPNFVNDGSWTQDRLNSFWFNYLLTCSLFDYVGEDKLTPIHNYFIPNKTWTEERTDMFYQDCLERSRYDYYGEDKLYPDSVLFISNGTWNEHRIRDYYNRSSSSNSDSSSDSISSWGGGGFDGGGASSDW